MFDALLYCQIVCQVMAEIRHGYFLIVADLVRAVTAQFRMLWAMARSTARGTWAQTTGRRPVACRQREAWLQSLARLETYVASMA